MMVLPRDAARPDAEWRTWLAEGRDFGTLVANRSGGPPEEVPDTGITTRSYSAVVFNGRGTVVADTGGKVRLLNEQMRRYQPEGGYGRIAARAGPCHRM